MIRKTLTILSLIGLVLSVGLWGVSYLNIFYRSNGGDTIRLGRGSIIWMRPGPGQRQLWKSVESVADISNPSRVDGFDGFKTNWRISRSWHLGGLVRRVLPLWVPASVFAACSGPLLMIPRYRRRRRRKLGLCIKCGYDLCGSSERCPECGTEFSN